MTAVRGGGPASGPLAELRGMGEGWRALRVRLETVATLTRIYRRGL